MAHVGAVGVGKMAYLQGWGKFQAPTSKLQRNFKFQPAGQSVEIAFSSAVSAVSAASASWVACDVFCLGKKVKNRSHKPGIRSSKAISHILRFRKESVSTAKCSKDTSIAFRGAIVA